MGHRKSITRSQVPRRPFAFEPLEGRSLHSATYKIEDLGAFGSLSSSFGNGMNDFGQVVGYAFTANNTQFHPYRTTPSGQIDTQADLGSLGGLNGLAEDINDAGQTTGYSYLTNDLNSHAYRTTGVDTISTISDLGTLGGLTSYGAGINEAGQVTGWSTLQNNLVNHAFRTTATGNITTNTDLGTLGGSNSYGVKINARGQVIGQSQLLNDLNSHAFRTSPTGKIDSGSDLGTLGGLNSYAAGINAAGEVVGDADLQNSLQHHAFRTTSTGKIVASSDLGTLGGSDSRAVDINDLGDVVGYSAITNNFENHAFIVHGNVMKDLNDLIPANSGWTLTNAHGINNNGQIVGFGKIGKTNQNIHAFRLTPIAKPTLRTISGKLWDDSDGNGVFDKNESVSGIRTVFLDLNGNGQFGAGEPSVQSNSGGQYTFSGLAAGRYRVCRVTPANYRLSNGTNSGDAVVVVISNASLTGIDLGSKPLGFSGASISGTLWDDANRNGSFDSSESTSGAHTVYIDGNGNGRLDTGEITTQSDSNGKYVLTGLAVGTYHVNRVFPTGYRLSNNSTNYLTLTVTVSAGQVKTGQNLGSRTV